MTVLEETTGEPAGEPTDARGRVAELHEDAERCAQVARLHHVSPSEPGIRRRRCGRRPSGSATALPKMPSGLSSTSS